MPVDAGDGLLRQDARLQAILLAQAEALEHGLAGVAHVALIVAVHLEQPIGALDDLHPRNDPRLLERRVGDGVDGDARRDLDEQRRLPLQRQEARRDRLQERRELRLQDVDERERA